MHVSRFPVRVFVYKTKVYSHTHEHTYTDHKNHIVRAASVKLTLSCWKLIHVHAGPLSRSLSPTLRRPSTLHDGSRCLSEPWRNLEQAYFYIIFSLFQFRLMFEHRGHPVSSFCRRSFCSFVRLLHTLRSCLLATQTAKLALALQRTRQNAKIPRGSWIHMVLQFHPHICTADGKLLKTEIIRLNSLSCIRHGKRRCYQEGDDKR